MIGTSTSSSQLGAPFYLHHSFSSHLVFFSLPGFHLMALLISLPEGFLVTLFELDAFQQLSLFVVFSCHCSYSPIALNLTPILSFSLYDGLSLQTLPSHCDFTAETYRKQKLPTELDSQREEREKKLEVYG